MTDQNTADSNRRPVLEWIVGAGSALLVCAIIVYLGHEALFGDTDPPELNATIDKVQRVSGHTLILVAVSNVGDQAAAEVVVGATVEGEQAETDQKEISFDYVASHSVRRGAFLLSGSNVNADDVHLAIQGYVKP